MKKLELFKVYNAQVVKPKDIIDIEWASMGGNDIYKILPLHCSDHSIFVLLNPERILPYTSISMLEFLSNFNWENIFQSIPQMISEDFEEEIVVYNIESSRLYTCLGYEVNILDEITE